MKENINVLICFSNITKSYRQYIQESMKGSFFSPNEIDLMLFLSNNKMDTAIEFVKETGISKSLVTRSVDSLVEQRFIQKEVDKADRRYVHLKLTKKGEDIALILRNLRNDFMEKLTTGITKEEFLTFQKTLERMRQNLENERND